jgi:hypothetical protein
MGLVKFLTPKIKLFYGNIFELDFFAKTVEGFEVICPLFVPGSFHPSVACIRKMGENDILSNSAVDLFFDIFNP